MRTIQYKKYGGPEVLKLADVEIPQPKEDEILVRVHSTSVTQGDVHLRAGNPIIIRPLFGFIGPRNPILGQEFSGEVVSVGSKVRNLDIGDAVFGGTEGGAYAEHLIVKESGAIAQMPDNLSYEEAAVSPVGATTALFFLEKAGIKDGGKVLINGASGSVGSFALQIAKSYGAEVHAVVGTDNIEMAKSLGADKVIDYRKENVVDIKEKYDIIFDAVGKLKFRSVNGLIAENGRFATTAMDLQLMIASGKKNSDGTKRIITGISQAKKESVEDIASMLSDGSIRPIIDRRYDLEKIADAHRYVDAGHKKGNVVINVNFK